MLKLAACEGNILQANRATQSQVLSSTLNSKFTKLYLSSFHFWWPSIGCYIHLMHACVTADVDPYPQMPLRASMLKLAACEGNILQANRATQSQVLSPIALFPFSLIVNLHRAGSSSNYICLYWHSIFTLYSEPSTFKYSQ
jgi:hypothetical protein